MRNKSNRNKIDILKDDLKDSLSISDVFERYFYSVKRKGNSSEALCPFHNDKQYGNFYINESKGFYKCFNCGAKGDIFSLLKDGYGYDFMEAVWILARDYNFITEEEFNSHNVKFDKGYKIKKQELKEKKEKENSIVLAELADENIIALVYEIFSELSPLKKEDRDYLINFRKIDENRVDEDYFTMPYCTKSFMDKLISKLEEHGLSERDLIGVPGFYISDNNKLLFNGYRGIGIKIKNSKSTRIQIRLPKPFLNKAKKPQRYIWFSSQHKYMGCSSGSPIDVLYPLIDKSEMKAVAFLTEGKFKSEKINQYYNSISLSMQGITSWKDKIKPEILHIQQDTCIKGIFICYDADMSSNVQVYYQCKEMVKEELNIFHKNNIFMVTWDASLGKGIDDLIDNGNKDKVKKIEFYKYEKIYDKFLSNYNKNNKGEILDNNGEVMDKEDVYKEYMTHVFPQI